MAKTKYAPMTVLRIFLYLICIISIGWSVLIFGGPPIIKKLIFGYSDGALVASGITVSPSLDISISRFEFQFKLYYNAKFVRSFCNRMNID